LPTLPSTEKEINHASKSKNSILVTCFEEDSIPTSILRFYNSTLLYLHLHFKEFGMKSEEEVMHLLAKQNWSLHHEAQTRIWEHIQYTTY